MSHSNLPLPARYRGSLVWEQSCLKSAAILPSWKSGPESAGQLQMHDWQLKTCTTAICCYNVEIVY
jgi:hypothetical protein